MSICRYCGQKAGWFNNAHDACVERAAKGVDALRKCISEAVEQGKKYGDVSATIAHLTDDFSIPKEDAIGGIKDGWSLGAEAKSRKQPISEEEFSALSAFYRDAGLTPPLRQYPLQPTEVVMSFSYLLWTVLNDQIEPYSGRIQFNLPYGEVPVFGIANVLLSEQRTIRSYVGGYGGASIRVAQGIYYHLGGIRGHRVENSALQEVDYGDFLMTTKAVYFGGTERGVNFRLPYHQIVRFQPYSDAVGICKNAGREQIFAPQQVRDSGWFLFNVLQALAAKNSMTSSHSEAVAIR